MTTTNKTVYVNGVIVGEVEATGDPKEDLKRVREFLQDKGLRREVTLVQAMYRQAMSFSTTASYLYERDLLRVPRNGLSVAPFVVNSAFSVELYLKTLHQLNGASLRGHALLELYDRLPATAREAVCAQARQGSQRYGVVQPTDDEFRGFMAALDTAFVDWRYAFEKGTTGQIQIPQLIVVMMALHEACKQAGAD